MLLVVLMLAGLIVALVLSMGNRGAVAINMTPVLRVLTAAPSTPAVYSALTSETLEPQIIVAGNSGAALSLIGPTLPAIVFTPTPMPITIGATVSVQGVGDQQLNVRDKAGVQGTTVLFRSTQGTLFIVVEGPAQADGFTWWRIQNPANTSETGWAVANYLRPLPPNS